MLSSGGRFPIQPKSTEINMGRIDTGTMQQTDYLDDFWQRK
jgi:hypothetical protein